MSTYILLPLEIRESKLWETDQPRSKIEALIDLSILAQTEENVSERKLAERWKWSRVKVKNFLTEIQKGHQKDHPKSHQKGQKKAGLSLTELELLEIIVTTERPPEKPPERPPKKPPNRGENELNSPDAEQELFEHWNQAKVVPHKKITNNMHISIQRALKLYSLEDLKASIDHYAEAYFDTEYEYCNYAWGIEKFLDESRGAAEFMNDGQKWLNYKDYLRKKPKPQPKPDGSTARII